MLTGNAGYSTGFSGYDIRILDRAMLGGSSPRDFAFGGIGPTDTNGTTTTFSGGQQYATLSAEYKHQIHDFGKSQIIGHALADAGSVWDLSQNIGGFLGPIDDSPFINSSVGVGLSWVAPISVLSLTYAKALTRRNTDVLQPIQLTFSTRF